MICLLELPSPFLIDDMVFPPLGLMTVSTFLRKYDHPDYNGNFIWHRWKDGDPPEAKIYGISATTAQYPQAILALKRIKELYPSSTVMLGGSHANVVSTNCRIDGFDCVVIGDIDQNYMMSPDRRIINLHDYKYYLNGKPCTTLVSSRGCPYHCAFCCTSKKVRLNSEENIRKEIDEIYSQGFEAIHFFDDCFVLERNRLIKIAEYLKQKGMIWRCFVRGNLINQDIARILQLNGCVEVGIGVESGSPTILKKINKGETPKQIANAIRLLQNEGIRVKGFFIIGLPGENKYTLDETEQFIRDYPLDDYDFVIFTPFPGSDIWNYPYTYDVSWNGTDWKDLWFKGRPGDYHSIVSTSMLDSDQIVLARDSFERRYKKWT